MKRDSGILLAISSLPSRYGIGCFDKNAYDFVDWLEKAGQRYWQILPLGVTSYGGSFDSPYQACSAFAGNPYFISIDQPKKEGVLTAAECKAAQLEVGTQVDYETLNQTRLPLLRKAYQRSNISQEPAFGEFCRENSWWLDDYALFMAVRAYFENRSHTEWPEDIRLHYGPSLDYYREKLYFEVEFHKYLQYKFTQQWTKLKQYANDKDIQIVGDIPIYVSPDGADVWANPELFELDEKGMPTRIAGCPPDGFNEEGQVWGNPLYRWQYHKQTGYRWWITRMWYSFQLYDVVRIDHFRGFDEYFTIPVSTGLAKDGKWETGPGIELFNALKANLGEQAVIVEDLGYMTDSVRQLVQQTGYPNMKVLQFAFDVEDTAGASEYFPHNYNNNCFVYTGTHDNETLHGWFMGMPKAQKKVIREYLSDHYTPDEQMYQKLINLSMMCAAKSCIIPVQDWLGLDNSARMNTPGTVKTNWRWRLLPGQLTRELGKEILQITKRFGRANWEALDRLVQKRHNEKTGKKDKSSR